LFLELARLLANLRRSQTWEAAQHPVSFFLNPILLQSRFVSGSIARKSLERFGSSYLISLAAYPVRENWLFSLHERS
jgi:hypothetical protein